MAEHGAPLSWRVQNWDDPRPHPGRLVSPSRRRSAHTAVCPGPSRTAWPAPARRPSYPGPWSRPRPGPVSRSPQPAPQLPPSLACCRARAAGPRSRFVRVRVGPSAVCFAWRAERRRTQRTGLDRTSWRYARVAYRAVIRDSSKDPRLVSSVAQSPRACTSLPAALLWRS